MVTEAETMSAKEQLEAVRAQLVEKGAQDVKFFFAGAAATEAPLSHVAADVAHVLRAYIDGRCAPLAKLGDSVR